MLPTDRRHHHTYTFIYLRALFDLPRSESSLRPSALTHYTVQHSATSKIDRRSNATVPKTTTTMDSKSEIATSGVASVTTQTPYQIFRNATETPSTTCLELSSDSDDEESTSDVESNDRDKENKHTKNNDSEESKDSVEHSNASIEYTNKAGVLSPNAMEIRQNARTLLMRQPHSKRTKRRTSLQPLSVSSFVNKQTKPMCTSHSGTNFLKPTKQLPKQKDLVDIKEELESDLEEIQRAARDMAQRAAEVGGEAIEAFEQGLETISMGARKKMRKSLSAFGQLWD